MVAEGVDEVQLGAGLEDLAEQHGRRALVDADLDDALAPGGDRAQQARVLLGVHRARGDQARADEHGAEADVVAQAVGREAPE